MAEKSLSGFFESFINKKPIFEDKKVLQSNYTPDFVSHRDEQMSQIAKILGPALRSERPSNIFIYGKTGCIAGDSLVYTSAGWKEIKDIDQSTEKVLSFDKNKKDYEWSDFVFLRFENTDDLLRFTLDNGQQLTVTKDHPLLSSDMCWKKADQINKDEAIIIGCNLPNITKKEVPLALARLLGFTISDGSLNRRQRRVKDSKGYWYDSDRQRFRYFSEDPLLLDKVRKDISELFRCTPSIIHPKDRCSHVGAISQQLCTSLNSLGVPFGKKSSVVEVPKVILESSNIVQREFLKALFSGDGTVSQHTYMIKYYSNSKKLLQQVSLILHQEGILCKIKAKKSKCNGRYFDSFRLYVSGQENLVRFYHKIGFYSDVKQKKLEKMLSRYVNNMGFREERYYASNIIKIETVKEDFVYDLTVPKNHNFIANCIISHNTGKTLTTTYTTQELSKVADEKNIPLKILYLNCKLKRIADTEYRLIAQLTREFGKEIPATGLPTDEIYKEFFRAVEEQKKIIIIILDEIDQLIKKVGDEILYNLIRSNSELKNSQIVIIGISNDLIFADNLDPRIKSSLSEEELIFPPYNALQIQNILRERGRRAFREGILQPGVIEKCAAYAAREHGDARRALELLRVAGEIAERNSEDKVSISHIDEAEEKIERDKVVDIVMTQPKLHQATLYSIIKTKESNKKIFTGEAYEFYKVLCNRIGLRPLTQRRISDIVAEFDMLGIINASVISKGRYGRTREITLAIPSHNMDSVVKILEEGLELS